VSSLRARLTAADPLVAVVALTSLVVYLLHGFGYALTRDLGVYMYGAQRFLDGDPPYVGILNRAGPLAHVLPAVGIRVGSWFGVGDLHSARFLYMLFSVACVSLVYVLARDLFRSRGGGLVAATAFLGFNGFLALATFGPREKTPMVLFLLVALLAMRHRRWATFGVFVALGTLTWQPVFFVLLVIGLVAIVLMPSGRWMALLRVVIGGGVTSGIVLVYYAAHHALHTFFEGFVLINARYTQQRGASSSRTWSLLQLGYGSSLWLILLGLVVLPVLSALAARAAWRTRDAQPVAMVALGAGWLAGMAWALIAFNGWLDLFEMLPFAALGLGGLAAAGLHWSRSHVDARVGAGVAIVLALALTAYATVISVTNRSDGLRVQRAAVASVLSQAPPGATILSVQAPEVLVLGHRRNPTPVQMFTNGFNHYVDDTWPGGLHGYASWVLQTRPDLIAVQNNFKGRWLTPILADGYRRVGKGPFFVWWASTELPKQVRQSMRHANATARANAQ
jgi:4-amino-4-deoxy-L-arabinose transferase-like glycosyltransferase